MTRVADKGNDSTPVAVNQGLGTKTNDTFDLLNFATAGFVRGTEQA